MSDQEQHCLEAIIMLREARERLLAARAPKAAEKVRRALKSAEGALRAARGRAGRQERAIEAFRSEMGMHGEWQGIDG